MNEVYFTPALFKFLGDLKKNNNREWFLGNKQRYELKVRDPLVKFVKDFEPHLRKISPYFVADPKPVGGSIMRIYRDIRFSKDKSPYKTSVALHFWNEKAGDGASPGFYIHIAPSDIFAGAGIWQPDGKTLEKVRAAIVADSEKWKSAISGNNFKSRFELSGELLKKPPRGYDPNHPLIEDLKRKDFVASTQFKEKDVCSPSFLGQFSNACNSVAPFVEFLTEAVGLPF